MKAHNIDHRFPLACEHICVSTYHTSTHTDRGTSAHTHTHTDNVSVSILKENHR